MDTINKHFKGAMPGHKAEQQVYEHLRKLGFTSENTLFADSSCPDELNHDDPQDSMTDLFHERWGNVFPLGGLAGIPFTGKTGWSAFSSHCPVDGNIVVMFAPHVGVDSAGTIGKVLRPGQHGPSTACGAAVGALAALEQEVHGSDIVPDYLDQQMGTILNLLRPHVGELKMAEYKQVALAYKMYEITYEFLKEIIHDKWMGPNSKLCLFGGIMINCDGKKTDHFLPLKFEVLRSSKIECFETVFGKEPSDKAEQNWSAKTRDESDSA